MLFSAIPDHTLDIFLQQGQAGGLWCLEAAGELAAVVPRLNVPGVPSDCPLKATTACGYFGTNMEVPSFKEIRPEEIRGQIEISA